MPHQQLEPTENRTVWVSWNQGNVQIEDLTTPQLIDVMLRLRRNVAPSDELLAAQDGIFVEGESRIRQLSFNLGYAELVRQEREIYLWRDEETERLAGEYAHRALTGPLYPSDVYRWICEEMQRRGLDLVTHRFNIIPARLRRMDIDEGASVDWF